MKNIISSICAILIIGGSLQAETYEIDQAHSTVGFRIRHLAISSVNGQFADFTGTFSYDPKAVEKSSVQAKISVASIDTENKKRDDHLRSEDFFAAEKFSDITFTSEKVTATGENTFDVLGELSMHGVKKPVTLAVEFLGEASDPYGNEKIGFSATAKLNRKDFGLQWSKVLETGALVVGDDVSITLDIQGAKKK